MRGETMVTWGQIGHGFTWLYNQLWPLVCGDDKGIARILGVTPWMFAAAKAVVFTIPLGLILYAWSRLEKSFNGAGFTSAVWRAGFWLLASTGLIQIVVVLIEPLGLVPCFYDVAFLLVVSALALYTMYFYHLGRKHSNGSHRGTLGQFMLWFVGPLMGEVAVGSRRIGETGAKTLIDLADRAITLVAHLHMVRV